MEYAINRRKISAKKEKKERQNNLLAKSETPVPKHGSGRREKRRINYIGSSGKWIATGVTAAAAVAAWSYNKFFGRILAYKRHTHRRTSSNDVAHLLNLLPEHTITASQRWIRECEAARAFGSKHRVFNKPIALSSLGRKLIVSERQQHVHSAFVVFLLFAIAFSLAAILFFRLPATISHFRFSHFAGVLFLLSATELYSLHFTMLLYVYQEVLISLGSRSPGINTFENESSRFDSIRNQLNDAKPNHRSQWKSCCAIEV